MLERFGQLFRALHSGRDICRAMRKDILGEKRYTEALDGFNIKTSPYFQFYFSTKNQSAKSRKKRDGAKERTDTGLSVLSFSQSRGIFTVFIPLPLVIL